MPVFTTLYTAGSPAWMLFNLQTYENNLTFLAATSKKGNSLIDEMNRKMERLRDDLDLVRQKIKAIDAEEK